MDAALFYLGYAPRTEHEVRDCLKRKEYTQTEIDTVVTRLIELRLIDDVALTADYVQRNCEGRFESRRMVRTRLTRRGIDSAVIETALNGAPAGDERNAAMMLVKKLERQFTQLDPATRRRKIAQRLAAKGFSYETAAHVMGAQEEEYE